MSEPLVAGVIADLIRAFGEAAVREATTVRKTIEHSGVVWWRDFEGEMKPLWIRTAAGLRAPDFGAWWERGELRPWIGRDAREVCGG